LLLQVCLVLAFVSSVLSIIQDHERFLLRSDLDGLLSCLLVQLNSLLLILGYLGCFVDLEVAAIRQQAGLAAQGASFVVV